MEKAEAKVREEAAAQIKKELESLAGFKTLDQAVSAALDKTPDSARLGDLGDNFNFGFKALAKTMAFKESDVRDFISRYVKNSENLSVIQKSLKIDYSEPELDEEKRELSFKLISSGQTVENIDKTKIILEITGDRKRDAAAYLDGLKEVQSAKIISPFWMRKIPKSRERVEIEVVE